MLIHCMSAQNIEREWISLTCTWLVVWGRVQIRIQKETKCETLVDSCSQQHFFSFFPVPCLHANTIWRHSSHGQRELLHLLFFCTCVNANIDSFLLRLELNCML